MARPFPRLSYEDALERYGVGQARPALRDADHRRDRRDEDAGARNVPGAHRCGRAGAGHRAAGRGRHLGHTAAQDQRGAVARPHRARRARQQAQPASCSRTPSEAIANLEQEGCERGGGARALQQVRRRARGHRAHRRRRGRAAGDGAGHPAPRDGQGAEAHRRRTPGASCGSSTSRCSIGTPARAAGTASTTRSPRRATRTWRCSTPIRERCGRRPTTSS